MKFKYRIYLNKIEYIAVMDGDGTIYRPVFKLFRIQVMKKTNENYKTDQGFDFDKILGRDLVIVPDNRNDLNTGF